MGRFYNAIVRLFRTLHSDFKYCHKAECKKSVLHEKEASLGDLTEWRGLAVEVGDLGGAGGQLVAQVEEVLPGGDLDYLGAQLVREATAT